MTNRLLTVAACGLLASGAFAQVQAFSMESQRKSAGVFLWDGSASPGFYVIQYGAPGWKAEYDGIVASKKAGGMRLGKDYWTTLDTSLNLRIGGVRVPRGQYYLGLERDDQGGFHLTVFRSRKIINENRNPGETPSLTPDFKCPLEYAEAESASDTLSIGAKAAERPMRSTLTLRWGKHELSAPVVASKPRAGGAGKKKGGRKKGGQRKGRKKGADKQGADKDGREQAPARDAAATRR